MGTESEDDMDDSDVGWQTVPIAGVKRRIEESPKKYVRKKPYSESQSTNNKFAILSSEEEEHQNIETAVPKPPPIYIPGVTNINRMMSDVTNVISASEFNYKCLKDGQIRLMVKTVDAYRNVVKHLEVKKINFHSYQLKQERAYRIVLKGLHFTTDVDDIKKELSDLGHKVRNIANIKSRVTKQPLSMFFVDLEPNTNNKEVFNIEHINNAIVAVEPPNKVTEILQCYRCQSFGHSKTYCRKQFKCVKCGLDHATSDCTKEKTTPPQCVNCLQNHTASYKGCKIYQELLQKRFTNGQNTIVNNTRRQLFVENRQQSEARANDQFFMGTEHGPSYSQVLQSNNVSQIENNSLLLKIESLINKQVEMTNNLMKMMNLIIEKLCK